MITVNDAASRLGISVQRVRTLCRRGDLESEKNGSGWVISAKSVERYGLLTAHTVAENHPAYALNSSKPIALSFFSGAMGLDIGIEKAGFGIRLACEFDKYCRQTIALNRPDVALLSDINDCTAHNVRQAAKINEDDDIDLIIGGPPCQAFSTAGKRKGLTDSRGNVFLKYLALCLQLRPRFFVIENVRGLLSCPIENPIGCEGLGDESALHLHVAKGGALRYITHLLDESGYGYSFNLYNAANFGSPQIRERVIIICSRDGEKPPFLVPTHSNVDAFGLPKWNVLRDCISDIKKHHHLTFPEKRLRYYKMISSGQNWKSLPLDLQKEALGRSFYSGGGKTGFLRRLDWDRPSPTLVTHPTMPATDLAHPSADRPLSIEEYKRIQEFPDEWEIAGPLVQQYKQVGNAVPVSLGYAVGSLIQQLLKGLPVKGYPDFPYSRYKNTSDGEWRSFMGQHVLKFTSGCMSLNLGY